VSAGGSAAYYDFNNVGSTIGMTGAAGSYLNKYSYLPFGETSTIAAGLSNLFTYVGQFGVSQDGNGTFNMKSRDYSATLGRFLSVDPTGVAAEGPNRYVYVDNRPTEAIDPQGTNLLPNIEYSKNPLPPVNGSVPLAIYNPATQTLTLGPNAHKGILWHELT